MTGSRLSPNQAEAMSSSILWYAVAIYKCLESASDATALEVANACQGISGENALHLLANEKFELPQVGSKSSFWILAYMASYIVWKISRAGPIRSLPDSPFLQSAYDAFRLYPLFYADEDEQPITNNEGARRSPSLFNEKG